MQRVLSKRVFRDLKNNFFRYMALFLLIALGMYMIVAIVGAAETVIQGVEQGWKDNCLEDGEFGVFVPLNDKEWQAIEEKGVTLQKNFSMDYQVENSTLRIMQDRELMNRFALQEGHYLSGIGEILLEQHYAESHGYAVGDTIAVGTESFVVAGVGSTPDYDRVCENMSDSSVDRTIFGTAFVSGEDYEKLRSKGESMKTEEYNYSYLLNGCMTDEELKDLIQSFTLDRSKVEDPYFLEMIEEAEETKNDITEGIDELLDGCQELSDGLFELADNNEDVLDGVDSIFEAMLEQVNTGLEDSGINVVLNEDDFEQQLNRILANPSAYSAKTKQDLADARQSLCDLREFRDGVKEYTDAVGTAHTGSEELCEGLSQLTDHSSELSAGGNQLFGAMLAQVNGELAEAGLPLTLTEEDYVNEIDAAIAAYGAYRPELAVALESAKEQLQSIHGFSAGIKSYTDGVCAAENGSRALRNGLGALNDVSGELRDGANDVFDAVIDMVNEQLEESDLGVQITADNFEAQLDALTAPNSKVDKKLRESLSDAKESLLDLQEFKDGMEEYTDGVVEAADGSVELLDGVKELQEEADEMLEEYFTFDLDNLTLFVTREDNSRIGGSTDDVVISKYVGMMAGVIVMILFTYVISVFVVHNIEEESSVIGALYALGVTRRQLMFHYLLLPVAVTVIGCCVGSIVGFSKLGIDGQMAETVNYFSMPYLPRIYPGYLIVYALVMPPVVAVLVNYLVISKKLKATALSMMRGEQKRSGFNEINLGEMGFVRKFQLRQMLHEIRSATAIIGGMLICLIILMMAVDCYVLCENLRVASINETKFEYMYSYKYPTKEVPAGGTAAYMEGLNKEALGYKMEVSILGLPAENAYFDVNCSKKRNELVISSAVATKFDVGVGEKLVLSDEINEKDYAFTVAEIVPYDSALYTFMDIDVMRELFDQEDDYYNTVFADEELDIENGRLYATTSKENVRKASEVFVNSMWPMVIMLCSLSVIIFLVVMYLMIKVMIDRSSFSIALMKILGYRKKEIKKLYLDGNFLIIAAGAAICIPLSKIFMDAIYPNMIANVSIGLNLRFDWQMYVAIYGGVLICYLIINRFLVHKLHQLVPAEVLKNRE